MISKSGEGEGERERKIEIKKKLINLWPCRLTFTFYTLFSYFFSYFSTKIFILLLQTTDFVFVLVCTSTYRTTNATKECERFAKKNPIHVFIHSIQMFTKSITLVNNTKTHPTDASNKQQHRVCITDTTTVGDFSSFLDISKFFL